MGFLPSILFFFFKESTFSSKTLLYNIQAILNSGSLNFPSLTPQFREVQTSSDLSPRCRRGLQHVRNFMLLVGDLGEN